MNGNVCVWHQLQSTAKIFLQSTWSIIMYIKQISSILFKGIKEIQLDCITTLCSTRQTLTALSPSGYNIQRSFFLAEIHWSVFPEAASTCNNFWIFLRAKNRFWWNNQSMTLFDKTTKEEKKEQEMNCKWKRWSISGKPHPIIEKTPEFCSLEIIMLSDHS